MKKLVVGLISAIGLMGQLFASGSESSSGSTREKDSSKEEMRSSMREKLRAKHGKKAGSTSEVKEIEDTQEDEQKTNKPVEDQ